MLCHILPIGWVCGKITYCVLWLVGKQPVKATREDLYDGQMRPPDPAGFEPTLNTKPFTIHYSTTHTCNTNYKYGY